MDSMNIEALKQILQSWINEGYSEGEMSVEPEWYVLWHPDEIEEINRDYQLPEYAPGFVTFGGNGGGELLVVNDEGDVFYLPAIGMAPDTAIKIARSLQEFKGFMQK
ncbi:SMI1/KNR4 family protein [Rheinheimera pacifica]|uniref:SMI1/KNR4 family protein n=1 Tax=Rheinheimera pacifica TaxID=173990 RepID=UPI002EDA42C6